MYKHILIPTDGSDLARKAVEAGIDYARESGARVTLFTAVPEYRVPGEAELMSHRAQSLDDFARESAAKAQAILSAAAAPARWVGVDFGTDYALSDHPYQAIVEAARRHRCDAIFMSSHGRKGLARLLHGSQAFDVLAHSDIPTVVYR